MRKRIDKKQVQSKLLRWIRNVLIFFFSSTLLVTIVYRFVPVYVTPLMLSRSVEQLLKGEELKMKKRWVSIEEVSPNVVTAFVSAEDNKFMSHHGFDFGAIRAAWKRNQIEKNNNGGRIYGGSTISQQTAKNVFLWQGRSWLRKGLEVYFTFLIEIIWGKQRIMEVYVNVVEMGDGIYGIERASEIYYHTSAKKLTKEQSAMIAISLPNPRRFNPSNPSAYMYKRQRKILNLMSKKGRVTF